MNFVDVVEVVSAVLRQLDTGPYEDLYFIRRKIVRLEVSTRNLERNKYFPTNDELKKLKNLLAAVYMMEDFCETFVLRRMHVRRMGFCRRYIFILHMLKATVLDFRNESWTHVSDIHDAIKALMNVEESGVSRGEVSDVVGLEEGKGELVRWLTDTNSRPNLGVILISGRAGSGKTTLATEIYKSHEIESHFDFRAWVYASDDTVTNLQSILQQISTGDSTVDMKSTVIELEEKICAILQNKRWLVVVENVRSPIHLFQGSAFSDEGNGSRLILTTRSPDPIEPLIVEYATNYPSLHYKLQPLHSEDAWHLFSKNLRLPDTVQLIDSAIVRFKEEIAYICEGIPLAIVVLGRLLSTKKHSEWLEVLMQFWKWSSGILGLITGDITFEEKRCLLYFGLFPREYEIPMRRLWRLWLAEGFVTEPREQTAGIPWDPEQTAAAYLEELGHRGMIEIATERKDGSPKTFRMPGILYDICLSNAEDIFGLLHIHPTTPDPESSSDHASPSPKFGVRRVSGDIKKYSCKDSHMQQLRSYLSFNTQNKDTPALEINNFLSTEVIGRRGFGMLKVLDLERVYKPELPHNLGQLYQLRYFGLRWTFLDKLPHSVSKLRFLETLDVKHTNISSPPNSIWKMTCLRHLCLNEIRLDMPVKKQSISLHSLHTLRGLFVDIKSRVKHGLDGLTNLRRLGLTFHLDSVNELNEWIASLKGLESLRLRSKDGNGRPSQLKLNPLSGLVNLTDVYLLGKLPELQSEYFPQSIKILTLSVSKLEKDPMPILAKLPNLCVLRLLADSYTGKEMVWPPEGFPELVILKLWMLKELETWTVDEGAITGLNELEIRCCHKLKKLLCPQNFFSWTIVLTNMPEELVDTLRQDDNYEELIIKHLSF